MAEMAESLTVSTAAFLMLCNKASGLPNLIYDSGKWKDNCKKLRKELDEQVQLSLYMHVSQSLILFLFFSLSLPPPPPPGGGGGVGL